MDPYKVLGVTPQTSDDDVKRAYRELARKYHPDNYVNNPLADLAETRMKEINEAYDMIMNERRNPAGGSSGQQQSYGGAYNSQQYGGYQQRTYTGANAALYSQVRQAINQGNLGMAEALLQRAAGRDAEWFYLTGTVYYRKGWYVRVFRSPFLFIGWCFMAYIYIICTIYAVGCAKVNCPRGKRRCPGVRPRRTACKVICNGYPVGAVIGRPRYG